MKLKNKKILLIEDNEADIELTILAFKQQNIIKDIIVLRDGQEALDYLFYKGKYLNRDIGDNPVITLLDLNLPKISGIEVLRKIREEKQTKYLPVVILTSSNEEKDIIDSYKLYANSYICKPVDFIKFKYVVKQLEKYWLLNESMPNK